MRFLQKVKGEICKSLPALCSIQKRAGISPRFRLSKNSPQEQGLSVKRGKKCEKGGRKAPSFCVEGAKRPDNPAAIGGPQTVEKAFSTVWGGDFSPLWTEPDENKGQSCLMASRAEILTPRLAGRRPKTTPTRTEKARAIPTSQRGMMESLLPGPSIASATNLLTPKDPA